MAADVGLGPSGPNCILVPIDGPRSLLLVSCYSISLGLTFSLGFQNQIQGFGLDLILAEKMGLYNPPIYQATPSEMKIISQYASHQIALILECIWKYRNQVVHLGKSDNPLNIIKALEFRVLEHIQSLEGEHSPKPGSQSPWCPPPTGTIKINVDAAIHASSASIAAVARDDSGMVLKAWAKKTSTAYPIVAEASAILWALQLAKSENWRWIMVESDSKNCVDTLLQEFFGCYWNISAICNDIKCLALEFFSCCFCWVRREANMLAHALAKYCLSHCLPVIYFPNNLPVPVVVAWSRDLHCNLAFV